MAKTYKQEQSEYWRERGKTLLILAAVAVWVIGFSYFSTH